ncbi:GAF domain-containing protein [bacterium]|nr:GAF domain-containing protein [bacterium]
MDIKQSSNNEAIKQGEGLIKETLDLMAKHNYSEAHRTICEAQNVFNKHKSDKHISICLSLIGLLEYYKTNKYLRALTYLNDAKYLANFSKSQTATIINKISSGDIYLSEKNYETALADYEKAKYIAREKDEYELLSIIEDKISNLRAKYKKQTNQSAEEIPVAHIPGKIKKRDPLTALLKISQTISAETDVDTLIEVIAEETKAAIQADRCSVFLYDKNKDELWSKVALGMDKQEIRFPAGKGLAGFVVKTGEPINIKDAYNDDRFNKEIDLQTGYRTKTILCMPIKNLKQEIIGAFQVLNKLDGEFEEEDEDLLIAIGSSAGVALENAQLFKQQQQMLAEEKRVFDSFIDTLAASIDARDKITAGHSSRVKLYSSLIAKQFNFDEKMIEIIEKAATLHDIGKIGIRDAVLQKDGKLTDEEYKHIQQHVEITHNILQKIHMSDDFKLVTEIACTHHEKYDGTGYYRHLKGEEIPFGGRILAVSDVFDAITSKRHYRDKMPILNVITIMIKDSGSHFDKSVVDCFLSISIDKIVKVFLTENDLVLKPEDGEFLKNYNLLDLYKILSVKTEEDMNEEEKKFVNLFNLYYTAKTSGKESSD